MCDTRVFDYSMFIRRNGLRAPPENIFDDNTGDEVLQLRRSNRFCGGQRVIVIGAGVEATLSSARMLVTMSRLSRAAMALTNAEIGTGGL